MRERGILFNGAMVRALLAGTKTQTRRVAPIAGLRLKDQGNGMVTWSVSFTTPLKGVHSSHSGGKLTEFQARSVIASQFCPLAATGDRLYVRETWRGPLVDAERLEASNDVAEFERPEFCVYAADGGAAPEFVDDADNTRRGWSPSIHMPRWASRITLAVTDVRVERLNAISEADAEAEGVDRIAAKVPTHRDAFRYVWGDLNGAGSWDANPWCWTVSFRRVEA